MALRLRCSPQARGSTGLSNCPKPSAIHDTSAAPMNRLLRQRLSFGIGKLFPHLPHRKIRSS